MNGTYRPDDPNNPGFASGVWADGGKIYPGSGSFTAVGCSLQNPGVAMIRTSSPSGAGAYQSYGAKPPIYLENFESRLEDNNNTRSCNYLKHSNGWWK